MSSAPRILQSPESRAKGKRVPRGLVHIPLIIQCLRYLSKRSLFGDASSSRNCRSSKAGPARPMPQCLVIPARVGMHRQASGGSATKGHEDIRGGNRRRAAPPRAGSRVAVPLPGQPCTWLVARPLGPFRTESAFRIPCRASSFLVKSGQLKASNVAQRSPYVKRRRSSRCPLPNRHTVPALPTEQGTKQTRRDLLRLLKRKGGLMWDKLSQEKERKTKKKHDSYTSRGSPRQEKASRRLTVCTERRPR